MATKTTQINNTTTMQRALPSGLLDGFTGRADIQKLKFLLSVCNRKPYTKPLLITDASGGHFTTYFH